MDHTKHSQSTLRDRLALPVHSDVSSVLNGIGNGAMIAAVPIVAINVVSEITKKPLAPQHQRNLIFAGVIATVFGSTIGAVNGLKEAHKVREYRNNVSEEIRKLRADVDAHAHAHTQHSR